MNSSEEQKGPGAPGTGGTPSAGEPAADALQPNTKPFEAASDGGGVSADHGADVPKDGSSREPEHVAPESSSAPPVIPPAPEPSSAGADPAAGAMIRPPGKAGGGGKTPPPPPGDDDDEEGGEDSYMLRMSFLEHLEELRSRIIKSLLGVAVAFIVSIIFTDRLWAFVSDPAITALKSLGFEPTLVQITPMEAFNVIWIKLPVLCAIFLSSPWILGQVWGFISPGLYRRERRWAAPFVIGSAGLFILGGVFAYFVAFRFGLTFLLGIGRGNYVKPMVSITEYFDLFVNVTLGVALVFELPVIIFFLTLLRIVSPSFLVSHSRYAILAIFIIAAIVTPTPDVFNLMLFATPMVLLFYVGIFAAYLLVLHRENRRFPWMKAMTIVIAVLLLLALVVYLSITKYGMKLVPHWPFLSK
jgi:sec-independent protein translocase protein TatC